jgi:hypothetical protein
VIEGAWLKRRLGDGTLAREDLCTMKRMYWREKLDVHLTENVERMLGSFQKVGASHFRDGQ